LHPKTTVQHFSDLLDDQIIEAQNPTGTVSLRLFAPAAPLLSDNHLADFR
jgi:hypothetical protein